MDAAMFDDLRDKSNPSRDSRFVARVVAKACLGAGGILIGMPLALVFAVGSQGAHTIGQGFLSLALGGVIALLSLAAVIYALFR